MVNPQDIGTDVDMDVDNTPVITDERIVDIITGKFDPYNTNDTTLTDAANGFVFVEMFGRSVRFSPADDMWFLWDGTSWKPDARGHLKVRTLAQYVVDQRKKDIMTTVQDPDEREAALREAEKLKSITKLKAIVDIASGDPRVHVDSSDFDNVYTDLACVNGVVNLSSGELRGARSDDMVSRHCTVPYKPEMADLKRSPVLTEFVDTFMPEGDDWRYLMSVLGHALIGGNERRMLPIFFGGTTSGKSQLFNAVLKVIGKYGSNINPSIFRGNIDDKPRPDLVNAMFTRVAIAAEASKAWSMHADQVKKLTGNDTIPYRNLYQGVQEHMPRFTPIIVTNVIPHVVGADWPTKKRILTVHFDRSLTAEQEDPKKRAVFLNDQSCLETLLALMVQGARDTIIDEPPARFVEQTMNVRADMDSFKSFMVWAVDDMQYLVKAPNIAARLCVQHKILHELYLYWLKKYAESDMKKDMLTLRELGGKLRAEGWESRMAEGTRWIGWKLSETVPPHVNWV